MLFLSVNAWYEGFYAHYCDANWCVVASVKLEISFTGSVGLSRREFTYIKPSEGGEWNSVNNRSRSLGQRHCLDAT